MKHNGLVSVTKQVWKCQGIRGFYKGALPTFIGSVIFPVQFSVFEAVYTFYKDNKFLKKEIPFTFGLQPRVVLGGFICS